MNSECAISTRELKERRREKQEEEESRRRMEVTWLEKGKEAGRGVLLDVMEKGTG